MRYYKIVKNGEITGYSKTQSDKSDCSEYVEITKDEYDAAIEEMKEQAEAQAKDAHISELEKENAALFFQMLTGEEYADV